MSRLYSEILDTTFSPGCGFYLQYFSNPLTMCLRWSYHRDSFFKSIMALFKQAYDSLKSVSFNWHSFKFEALQYLLNSVYLFMSGVKFQFKRITLFKTNWYVRI